MAAAALLLASPTTSRRGWGVITAATAPKITPDADKQQQQQQHTLIRPYTGGAEQLKSVVTDNLNNKEMQQQRQQQQRQQQQRQQQQRKVADHLCDAAEAFIQRYIDPRQLPARRNPDVQMADNFAPVQAECPPAPCRVHGTIPACLRSGVYLRNGSNPILPPEGGYHYFDGHGMLHAVTFPSNRCRDESSDSPSRHPSRPAPARYCARFTRTSRYLQESRAGKNLFPNPFGGLEGASGVARIALLVVRAALGLVDLSQGDGPANAGLCFHAGRLLVMSENDAPYAVAVADDGDLLTLGRYNFAGDRPLTGPMTAHPKLDPLTGELFTYGYNVLRPPYLTYFSVSPDGVKSREVAVDGVSEPSLLHDFAVTERFAVMPESQLMLRLGNLLKGQPMVACDASKVPRFGVIPKRCCVSEEQDETFHDVRWFEVPGFTALHFVNAWEEDDGNQIVLVASRNWPLEATFDNPASLTNSVHEVRLDLTTGTSTQRQLSPAILDVGQFNRLFTGRRTRYAYMCISGPWPKYAGVAKVDLQSQNVAQGPPTVADCDLDSDPAIAAWRKYGNSKFGSEPFFVSASDSFHPDDEDDGYLLCFVHDEKKNVSELLIMDARSPTLETVATVELPCRVPYGFHGLFISEQQLATQNSSPL